MRFLNPSGLWLLLGVPILILIYIIKSQHEDRPVSSTYIWKLSSRFLKKRLPLQHFRKFFLFLLQLLMIVTTALMVARPAFFLGETCEYIAILDLSASMQTADGSGTTRLTRAVEQIEKLAEKVNNGHKVTVILAGDTASYLLQSATSASEVEYALKNVEATPGGCDLEEALTLAQPICERSQLAEVIFYTDCSYSSSPSVSIVNVNQSEWNIAVESITLTNENEASQLTGSIVSYNRDATVTAGLKIDGKTVDAQIIICQSNVPTHVVFTSEPLGTNYNVEIFVEENDGLTLDNSYCICSESNRNCNVLLLSQAPFYLNSALNALGNCEVTIVSTPEEVPAGGYDLYIFDGLYPETTPPDGAILQFGASSMPTGISFGESITAEGTFSTIEDVTGNLCKDLVLDGTVLAKYTPLIGDSRWEDLFECGGKSVGMTSKTAYNQPYTILSFDLHDSNLPMQQDFVVLMRNLVKYSVPSLLEKNDFTIGETISLNSLPSADGLYVKYPDGNIRTISTVSNRGAITAENLGLHTAFMTMGIGGEAADFFVHIPESETIPQEGDIIEWSYTASPNLSTAPVEAFTEIWFWLAAALLLLILLEWGVYYYEQY